MLAVGQRIADFVLAEESKPTTSTIKTTANTLTDLKRNLEQPTIYFQGKDPESNIRFAKDMFARLDTQIADPKIRRQARLDACMRLIDDHLAVCQGGLMSGIQDAVMALDAEKTGFPAALTLTHRQLQQHHALNHTRKTDSYYGSNEVHFANAHINAYAEKFGAPLAEQPNPYLDDAKNGISRKSFAASIKLLKEQITPERLALTMAESRMEIVLEQYPEGSSIIAKDPKYVNEPDYPHEAVKTLWDNTLGPNYKAPPIDYLLEAKEGSYEYYTVKPKPQLLAAHILDHMMAMELLDPESTDVLIKNNSVHGEVAMLGGMVFIRDRKDNCYEVMGRKEVCTIDLAEINESLKTNQPPSKSKGFFKSPFRGASSAENERNAILGTVVQHVLAEYRQELLAHRQQAEAGNNPVSSEKAPVFSETWLTNAALLAKDQKLPAAVTQPLLELAIMADLPAVLGTLKGSSVNFDMPLSEGLTALSLATDKADTNMLEALISAGAKLDSPNADSTTALMHAARHNRKQALKTLAEKGAKLLAKDSKGDTALLYAVKHNQCDAIGVLAGAMNRANGVLAGVMNRAKVDHPLGKEKISAAMWAAKLGTAEALTVLLIHGANRTQKGRGGESLLMTAVANNNAEIIELLNPDRVELLAKDHFGATSLMHAAADGGIEALLALTNIARTHGVLNKWLNAVDSRGQSALMHAAQNGKLLNAKHLIDYGANKGLTDKRGNTALFHAARGSVDCVKLLINEMNADLRTRNKDGDTAGLYAARHGATSTLACVMQNPSDFLAENKQGKNALMLAAQGGHTKTLKALVDLGVDINSGNKTRGTTALMSAVHKGQLETIKALVRELAANVNQPDSYGFTPAMKAVQAGQPEALYTLGTLGADMPWQKLNSLIHAYSGTMDAGQLQMVRRRLRADGRPN